MLQMSDAFSGRAADAAGKDAPRAKKEPFVSMRVLIIDPDWQFLRQARDYLEQRGHVTVHEAEPAAALKRAEHWKPDLVLASVELPPVSDGDLLQRLAHLQPRPAILLTAGLDRFDRAWRAWQRGGDEVLFKPLLHPSELHVAIVTAMEAAVCPKRRNLAQTSQKLSA